MAMGHESPQKSTTPDNTGRVLPHAVTSTTRTAELEQMLRRASASPRLLSSGDVLQLQRTIGNQAVRRLLQRDEQEHSPAAPDSVYPFSIPAGTKAIQRTSAPESIQREEEEAEQEGSEELTPDEEQQLLQAKRLIQRRAHPGEIQRAWTGRRQLGGGGLNTLLGKPWVIRKAGNFFRLGGYHEHIFFEDGQAPPDIGHMGTKGLGQDTGREDEYAKVETGLNDAKMRAAVEANKSIGEPGKYSLLSNNCQDFVQKVLKSYRAQ